MPHNKHFDIHKLASLAKISLDEKMIEKTTESLEGIITWLEGIQSVDTSQITPMSNPLSQMKFTNMEDVSQQKPTTSTNEDIKASLFEMDGNMLLVPKVIQK